MVSQCAVQTSVCGGYPLRQWAGTCLECACVRVPTPHTTCVCHGVHINCASLFRDTQHNVCRLGCEHAVACVCATSCQHFALSAGGGLRGPCHGALCAAWQSPVRARQCIMIEVVSVSFGALYEPFRRHCLSEQAWGLTTRPYGLPQPPWMVGSCGSGVCSSCISSLG